MRHLSKTAFFATSLLISALCVQPSASADGAAPAKAPIAEITSVPAPQGDVGLEVLKDGRTSQERSGQVQWTMNKHIPSKQAQVDLTLKPGLTVGRIALHANQRATWGVFAPVCVTFKGSADGREWRELGSVAGDNLPDVSDKWYEVKLSGTEAKGLSYVRLIVQSPRTDKFSCIWVDEISVDAEGAADASAKAPAAPPVRNYVANGSFEIDNVPDVPDFWHVKAYAYYLDRAALIDVYSDVSTAYAGKRSLCFDSRKYKEAFEANPIYFRQGLALGRKLPGKYTLSFYAKASVDGARLNANLGDSRSTFKLGTEWTKCVASVTQTKEGPALLDFEMTPVKGSGSHIRTYPAGLRIWIDAVQVEDGEKSSDYVESHLDAAATFQPEATFLRPALTPVKVADGRVRLGSFFTDKAALPAPSVKSLHRLQSAELIEGSSVYLLYDTENLYVCVQANVPGGAAPKASVTKDDGAVYTDDSVEIFIQPDSNVNCCFHYAVNCEGAVFDAQYQNGPKVTWNAPFKKAIAKGDGLWTAEVAIPLKWLESLLGDGEIRFNICRDGTSWAPVQNKFLELERFGVLKGLDFLKRKPQLSFGSFTTDYSFETGARTLRMPLVNESGVDASFTVKTTVRPMNGINEREISIESSVALPPGGRTALELTLPPETRGCRDVEAVAFDGSGKPAGRYFQSMVFMEPLFLRAPRFALKGEEIKAEPLLRFNAGKGLSLVTRIKDKDGRTLLEKTTAPGQAAAFPSAALPEGWLSMETTLTGGKSPLSSVKSIYIAERASSWSKVDPATKELVVNGRSFIPIGVYYMPADGLSYLKSCGFDYCVYRTEWGFDPARCIAFLDEAERSGITVFLEITTLTRHSKKSEPEILKRLDEIVAVVKSHPAYAGLLLCDEPNCLATGLMSPEGLARLRKHVEEVDPTHVAFSVVAGARQYACDSGDVFFYDHYATVTGPLTRGLRDNNDVVKAGVDVARFFDKPLWRCIEGNEGCFPNLVRQPTIDEWRVLVFSTFASGGDGIALYGGIPAFASLREPYAKAIKDLRKIAPALVRGVKSERVGLESKDDILWSAVDFQGKTVVLAVNLDFKPVQFTLKVKGKPAAIREILPDETKGQGAVGEASFQLKPYGVMAFEL